MKIVMIGNLWAIYAFQYYLFVNFSCHSVIPFHAHLLIILLTQLVFISMLSPLYVRLFGPSFLITCSFVWNLNVLYVLYGVLLDFFLSSNNLGFVSLDWSIPSLPTRNCEA